MAPNPGSKYNIATLKLRIKDPVDHTFARDFAATIKAANEGDQTAIDVVESYVYPDEQELIDLGIHRSHWGPLRKCTDLGLLFQLLAKDQ
jgi:hypothetical protein